MPQAEYNGFENDRLFNAEADALKPMWPVLVTEEDTWPTMIEQVKLVLYSSHWTANKPMISSAHREPKSASTPPARHGRPLARSSYAPVRQMGVVSAAKATAAIGFGISQ